MCVVLIQMKNGFRELCFRLMKSSAPSMISSSIVSIRFFVSGPVSSIVCLPLFVTRHLSTPRGPYRSLKFGKSVGFG